jgi:hypothetical protein
MVLCCRHVTSWFVTTLTGIVLFPSLPVRIAAYLVRIPAYFITETICYIFHTPEALARMNTANKPRFRALKLRRSNGLTIENQIAVLQLFNMPLTSRQVPFSRNPRESSGSKYEHEVFKSVNNPQTP